MFNPLLDIYLATIEAQQVIWLRTFRIAQGGKLAEREAKRMVGEKVEAAARAGALLATGAPLAKVAKIYRKKIRANRKRLSGG